MLSAGGSLARFVSRARTLDFLTGAGGTSTVSTSSVFLLARSRTRFAVAAAASRVDWVSHSFGTLVLSHARTSSMSAWADPSSVPEAPSRW